MMQRTDFTPLVPFMPENPLLYRAYVPYQIDVDMYNVNEALEKGTLFIALDSPYAGNVRGDETLC